MVQLYKALNKDLNEIEYTEYYVKSRNKSFITCDNIMCFDIEVSNGFIHEKTFDVEPFLGKSQDYYSQCIKVSIPYIWQFSIDDNVFIGRTLEDFKYFLYDLEEIEPYNKIVYIHNFSYEFQFLRNVLDFTEVFAREKRKPIYAKYGTYTFRCSYMLTRQSLDSWAKNEKLPIKKLTGNLDYNVIRTPKTALTEDEINYCINDVLVTYYGLLKYKEKYGHINDIPLTQTGEVRKIIREKMNVPQEYKYRKMCIELIPNTLADYKRLVRNFVGGYTHSNYVHTGIVLENVKCRDISSSYTTVMCLEKYPSTSFVKCEPSERYFNNDKYSYMIEFTVEHLSSKRWNTFLSFSKCLGISKDFRIDNGRVISASFVHCSMINTDFEIFNQCYDYDNLKILDFRISMNKYLSDTFVKYVLKLYNDKTQLKGIEEYAEKYAISKQYINSLFGMMVTKNITDEINFTDNWGKVKLNEEIFQKKIAREKKQLSKTFTAFQFGLWVTGYARRNLWQGILALDYDVVYCDTDSIKHIGNHNDFFNEYNKKIEEKEKARAKMLGIKEDSFAPKDKKGIEHRLGVFDIEPQCDKFKTLGAKKYICEIDGKLKMTVSGVRKSAVSQIKDINDFNEKLTFDIEHANKLLSSYNDNMPPVVWNRGKADEFKSNYKYGITLQPTTYSMSITPEYAFLLSQNMRGETDEFEIKTKVL